MKQLEIKAEATDYVEIEGYGVLFDQPNSTKRDSAGDYFTKDTDLALDKVSTIDVFADHSIISLPYPIGESVKHETTEKGVKFFCRLFRGERLRQAIKRYADIMGESSIWIDSQLEIAERYLTETLSGIKSGIIGFSSGAVNHLVRRVQGWLKRWPVYEISLSRNPCEKRLLGEIEIKSLAVLRPDLDMNPTIIQDGELAYEISDEAIKAGGSVWKRIKSIFVRSKEEPLKESEMDLAELKTALTEALKPVSDALATVTTKLGEMDGAVKSLKPTEPKPVTPVITEVKPDPAIEAIKAENAALKSDLAALKSSVEALTKKPDGSQQGAPVTPTTPIKSPFGGCVKEH